MLRRVHPVGLFRGPGIRFRGFCDASREELLREHLISHWISGRGCRVQYRAPLCRRDGVTPSGRTWKRFQPGKENRSGSWTCYWLPELAALISITMGETVLFSVTGIDIAAARRFYHPDLADPWPVANRPLWSFFYRSAPWVTTSLAVTDAALLVAGMIRIESRRLPPAWGVPPALRDRRAGAVRQRNPEGSVGVSAPPADHRIRRAASVRPTSPSSRDARQVLSLRPLFRGLSLCRRMVGVDPASPASGSPCGTCAGSPSGSGAAIS